MLAAAGYPGAARGGDVVRGLEAWPAPADEDRQGTWCFHAGTRLREDGKFVAAGGRVLTVVSRAVDRETARAQAYAALARLSLDGGQARNDVAAAGTAWTS